jgi:putative aldouronate transport system permease protein
MGRLEKSSFNAFDIFNIFLMFILMFICIYPLWYVLVGSFNDGTDYLRGGVYFWPRSFTGLNYTMAIHDKRLLIGFRNTLARTLLGTLSGVFFTSMVAYGMSRRDLPFKRIIYWINLITMFIGGGLIPYFLLLKQIHLIQTFWVYIIPTVYSVFNMIVIMNFFKDIPEEMHESGIMDGAGEFRIFLRLYLPLSTPVLGTIALWVGVGHWNSFFDSMVFASLPELQTLQLFLVTLVKEASVVQGEAAKYIPPTEAM